jgi:hypothetical protein
MLTHERVEFLGSGIVQNLLSVTVHLSAIQNIIILPNILHFPDWEGARIST